MTAERNGSQSPDDDPFAHLYRQEGGDASASSASQQPGVPRRSYNQVRTVGERQYGQPGAQDPQQPNAHYAAPETMPGGRAATRQERAAEERASRGRSHNGLLAGAIAVAAAVVIGIGAAVFFNNDEGRAADNQANAGAGTGEGTGDESGPDGEGAQEKEQKEEDVQLPSRDAATLRLDGGPATDNGVEGAEGKGGMYVAGFDKVGARVTWTFTMPEGGAHKLKVRYGIPGEDANATLVVNGKANAQPLGMKNFINSPKGDWEKGWQTTWAPVDLKKGENTVVLACNEGNQCKANIDKLWVAAS